MWTLSMFFFEIRYLFSLGLLLYLWYGIGLIDLYLHYMVTKELKKVVRLPVEIDSVTCYLRGEAVVKGIHILAPPIEEDARWELSHIATVDEVRVTFPFLVSLLFFLLSNGELFIADDVAVQGIRFYVEGFRSPTGPPPTTNDHSTRTTSTDKPSLAHDHAQSPAHVTTTTSAEEVVYNVFLIGAYEKHKQHKKARRERQRQRSRSRSRSSSAVAVAAEERHSRGSLSLSRSSDNDEDEDSDNSSDVTERRSVSRQRRCEQVVADYGMRRGMSQLREDYFPTIPNHMKEEDKGEPCFLMALTSDSTSSTSITTSLPIATPIHAHAPLSPPNLTIQPFPTSPPMTSTSSTTSLTPPRRQSMTSFFQDTATHWKQRLHEKVTHIKNKAKELHDVVQESGGIYNATKQRLVHVYEKTKQTIDYTIADKINQLHVYLCGYEPLPIAHMPRLICYHVGFHYLEIHLLRALPIQLRHLESKPLLVETLDFYDVGFDNLAHIPMPKDAQSNPRPPPAPPINRPNEDKAVSTNKSQHQHPLNHLLARLNNNNNNNNSSVSSGSSDVTKPSSLRSVCIRYTPDTEVNEVEVEEEDHSLHLLDLFSLDIWHSGMDAMIFKYHFERKILHKLFKSNAGRVLNDFFTISNWLHKTPHSTEEVDVSGTGIADSTNPNSHPNHHSHHNHHSHMHSLHSTSSLPPLHRTSFSERYSSNAPSQSQGHVTERSISCQGIGMGGRRMPSSDNLSANTSSNTTSRGIILTHPIFFDT